MKPALRTVMVMVAFGGRVSLAHPRVYPADTARGGYTVAVNGVPATVSPRGVGGAGPAAGRPGPVAVTECRPRRLGCALGGPGREPSP